MIYDLYLLLKELNVLYYKAPRMISVCIATFNGEKYIKKQIVSIIEQLSDNDEIVISDDGSCDKTVEIIQSFNDKRIKLLKHNKKKHITLQRIIYMHRIILKMP